MADNIESRGADPLDPGDPHETAAARETLVTPTDAPPTPQAAAAKVKKKRMWRRRLWLAVIAVLIIGIVVRIAVQVAFPIVLKKVAAGYGLDADFERLRMSMLSG